MLLQINDLWCLFARLGSRQKDIRRTTLTVINQFYGTIKKNIRKPELLCLWINNFRAGPGLFFLIRGSGRQTDPDFDAQRKDL